jgi:hypothetical protein
MSSNILQINKFNNPKYKKRIKNCMRGDKYQMEPPKLNENSIIVAQINENGEYEGFIHCVIKDKTLIFATGFTNENYRRKGISTKLRLWIMENIQNIDRYESLTMPGSHSVSLLEKMGFHKEDNKMVKMKK